MAYTLRILSLTMLVALWATSAMGLSMTKAEAVAAPGFFDGCQTCSKGEECRWCPDFGSLCFYQPRACCGCLESGCFSCPSSSSCALWSPFSPLQCPPPSTYNNNTRWGSCKWELQAAIEQGGRSVLRCNTVNPRATVDIVWNVVSSTGSESFDVLILDQENFNQYLKGGSFTCRNINCSSGGPPGSARGDIRVSGSKGYYVVTADRSERGTWNYSIFASIQ